MDDQAQDSKAVQSMDELRVLSDSETLKELSDPLRRRVLDELTREPRSGSQIARKLGVRPSKVHYALRELQRLDLIRLVGTKPIRGTTEKYYRAVARNFVSDMRLGPISAWNMAQLARYLGQPFLQQHRQEVLRIDARTLARQIVREHLDIQQGELVEIIATSETAELVDALVLEVQLAGAEEDIRLSSRAVIDGLAKSMPLDFIRKGRKREFLAANVDAAIYIADNRLWSMNRDQDPERLRLLSQRNREQVRRYEERGVRQLVLTPLFYENLNWDSLRDLELHDAYWKAILVPSASLRDHGLGLLERLERCTRVTIETGDHHALSFEVVPEHANLDDGLCREAGEQYASLPAGELVVLVDTATANGSIFFDYAPRDGKILTGIEMQIEAGRIVGARADGGDDDLQQLLEIVPDGGDLISILSLGLNPEISTDLEAVRNNLFGPTLLDRAYGAASIAFGSNRPYGGDRDVAFFWSFMSISPRLRIGSDLILENNAFASLDPAPAASD